MCMINDDMSSFDQLLGDRNYLRTSIMVLSSTIMSVKWSEDINVITVHIINVFDLRLFW